MNDRDIQNLFDRLSDSSELFPAVDESRVRDLVLESTGVDLTKESQGYGMRDYLEYYMWNFSQAMLKPMAAAVAVFLFAITGWISMANASQSALPGDKLYPVKLSVEKTQLALAFGADQRASLQMEFTSRRLEEMVEVSAQLHELEPQTVQLAVERFKNEVATIQQELSNDDASTDAATKELAKAVGRNAEAYTTTVTSTAAELSEEVVEEVEEIIEEAKEQAVEVIITAHETEQDEEIARELALAFEKELVLATEAGADQESLDMAQALADEGAYRRAFQVLKEIELTNQE